MGRYRRDDKCCGNFLVSSRVSYCETTVNDDAQLIGQALAGQTAAFGQLVQKYQDRLHNTVVHVVGNAEDAKDVVQEAFVQAFLKLESFQGASAFYTWLYRIAFNVAATFHRRRGAMRAAERTALAEGHLRNPDPKGHPQQCGRRSQRATGARGTLSAGAAGDFPVGRRAPRGARVARNGWLLL